MTDIEAALLQNLEWALFLIEHPNAHNRNNIIDGIRHAIKQAKKKEYSEFALKRRSIGHA